MSGSSSKKTRKVVNKAFRANKAEMLARVLDDMENNPELSLEVHNHSFSSIQGKLKRVAARIRHAWRIIDCSPKLSMRMKNK